MKMLTAVSVAIVGASLVLSQSALAQNTDIGTASLTGGVAPVDFRACNFKEGKTRDDLNEVAGKFRDYANKNDLSYAAWILLGTVAVLLYITMIRS